MKKEDALRHILHANVKYVIGIDEAGAGAWAGPLTVAGAVFEKGWANELVKDSKRYKDHARRMVVVNTVVKPEATQWLIVSIEAEKIDRIGLGKAKAEAFREVATKLQAFYPDSVTIIDGDQGFGVGGNVVCLPKADDLIPTVSAASLLAKTDRDAFMQRLGATFTDYGLERHVGYGTKEHRTALLKHGPIQGLHRRSYKPIAEIVDARSQGSQQSGTRRQAG